MRLVVPILLVVLVSAVPVAVPWLEVVLTIALAKGFAVLGIVVLLRAGQVSFGHALFFAASAYAAAFLTRALGGTDVIVLLGAGMASAAVLGVVIGGFVVRYRYIFFAMLNLAFSMVLYSMLEKFFYVTGGSDGMRLARPTFLGMTLDRAAFESAMFYLVLALAIVAAGLVHRYLASAPGQALMAIKTNETRLEYLGVSARTMLLVGYVVSATLAGLGGTILAVIQGLVTPDFGYWVRSGEFVFIAILGGTGHVVGAFAGALVYELVRTYAAALAADIWQLTLGVFLLLIILFASRGLVGLYQDLMGRVLGPPPGARPLVAGKAEG
jgi:ABC-type branched-subunit amino acid transport system permease subunit